MGISGRGLQGDIRSAITKLRKEGLSQRIIAERLGLCRRTVQKYFSAREAADADGGGATNGKGN